MAEKLTDNPELGLENASQEHIDAEFARMVENMALNGQLPEGVSLEQAMQVAGAIEAARSGEPYGYETEASQESAEDQQLSFVERVKAKFGWESTRDKEANDKFNEDSLSILDALGSTNASAPEHGVPETDGVKEMLGAKVVGAMVAGSEEDGRFARATLWELHTEATDAVDLVTYNALDSLMQLSEKITAENIDPAGAELLIAEEVSHQIETTARKDGGGKDARLQIEAMAAQIVKRVAPGSELHDHLILDARRTAAAITEGESRLTSS